VIDIEDAVAQMLDGYKDAVWTKNVDAFAALYDPAVRVFDLWGAWSYDGSARWRAVAADWFAALGTERVAVEFADVQSVVSVDVAVVHALVTYRSLAVDGRELRAMQNRLTWALTRSGEGWAIRHEHTSAPVDSDTSKVILRR
jgi:ketosteroid isomerase-like protein